MVRRPGCPMAETPLPPRMARWWLARLIPRRDRVVALAELDDLYALKAARGGYPAAGRWYRRQLLKFPARLWADRLVRGARAVSHPDIWRSTMSPESVLRDLKYALRRLGRAPGFSIVAVISLALGIGANTAMFSIVNAVIFADPPFADTETLVEVYTSDSNGTLYATWSHPDYEDLVERSAGIFTEVSTARTFISSAGDPSDPRVVIGEAVSPNLFTMHGVPMALGRSFGPEDEGPSGTSPVVILNHSTWVREFGSDPGIIGASYRVNQLDYTIIGVAAPWYTGTFPAFKSGIFVPINMIQQAMGQLNGSDPMTARGSRGSFVRARLAEGISAEQANAWMVGFAAGLEELYPNTNTDRIYTALPLDDILIHPIIDKAMLPVAGFLMGMVGIVLLIACMNLASFLMARAEQRKREIAVRLSLGAGRMTMVRQLLVETMLLGALGGLGGVLIARWAVDALVSVRPPIPIPINLDFPLDGDVLLYTLAISLAAGVFFGLLPALASTRPDLAQTLREEGGGVTGGGRARNILVVAQMSLSVVLLVGSGLFLRSLQNAESADPGFYTGPAALLWPQLSLTGMGEEEGKAFWTNYEERLLATPGVSHVAFTDLIPLGFGVQTREVDVPGIEGPIPGRGHDVDYSTVSPSFFETMEIEIIAGRSFDESQVEGGEPVMVVSRAFQERFFPEGAVGRTVAMGSETPTIIAVAEDTKVRTIGEDPRPRLYTSSRQDYRDGLQVIVRGTGTSGEILQRAEAVALDIHPRLVFFDKRTMDEHLAVHLFPPRMAALLLSVFGGLALLLAAIGIWGIVSHAVARRTREVGIRVSMGATGRDVVGMLVGGGMKIVGIGIVVGLALSAGAGVLVGRFLYGVGSFDPVAFIGIPLVLASVALVASWVPARRAAGVDPVRALRSE